MKKTLLIILLALGCNAGWAQTKVVKDAQGNYRSVKAVDTLKAAQVATFTDSKGKAWPVYKSASGRLYALRVSKNGNTYKMYLKEGE